MSHFSTLVITKDEPDETMLENILAPYDENLIVGPYIAKTREQLIREEKATIRKTLQDKAAWEKNGHTTSFNEDYYKTYIQPVEKAYYANDDTALYNDAVRYYESDDLDENGDLISTYNPDSKWDWWELGGRWCGTFDNADSIQKKDFPHIDLTRSESELRKEYPAQYQNWQDLISGKVDSFYKVEYLRERYPTFRTYLEESILTTTWAVIDPDGVWQEPGTVGWFGCSDAAPNNEANWTHDYYDRFIKDLPDDYWLTIVDCHI